MGFWLLRFFTFTCLDDTTMSLFLSRVRVYGPYLPCTFLVDFPFTFFKSLFLFSYYWLSTAMYDWCRFPPILSVIEIVRPSVCPSVRLSVRPSVVRFFSYPASCCVKELPVNQLLEYYSGQARRRRARSTRFVYSILSFVGYPPPPSVNPSIPYDECSSVNWYLETESYGVES
jgi:hypothetical protein